MTESAAPASIPFGMQDTLAAAGLPGDATGTVTFTSGGSTLCVATLPAASCLTASTLTPGTYPVTATYSGDGNYNGVIATGATFTVTKDTVTLTELASPATIVYGTTDTVSAGGLPAGATGTLTFKSGTTSLCITTLSTTSCVTPATLTPATYPVIASYSGDVNDTAATATGAAFTVIKADTAITVTVSPAKTTSGATVTVSAWGLPPSATGTVTFTSGGIVLCTATLPATSCSTTVTLPPGAYPVKATYSGNADYNGSSAVGSGQLGILSVVSASTVTVPETGAGQTGPRTLLGAAMIILGTGVAAVARGRRRSARKI